jgi:tetratricopeptide (TPR) repeat protein/tRNA A-37 threonylcarbamoyl transferase component Bud32/TolB-like protein
VSEPTPDLSAALQTALGPQYRLERELGRGGMGVVFQATDLTLDRRVAVKVVHPELTAHPAIAERFLAEARMLARIRHPNIVAVHHAGSADGLLYYVMDEIPGESLRQRLNREGPLPGADVQAIVADVAAALGAANEAGFVHRDVKPENVLLDAATGRALLADFGIARASGGASATTSAGQGIAVGTPTYMSPEQAAGEAVDGRSDLYGLGVVAYEALTGQAPFLGPNRVVISKHIAERPASLQQVRPDAPPMLSAAIMRALEKDPAERWQSGEELRRGLNAVEGPPARSVVRRRLAVAAVAAVAVVAALGLTRLRSEGPPAGVNPRHSMLILPFGNLQADRPMDWLRDGAVSMLGLNLSQWNDLTVVDHERVHDLLARNGLKPGDDIGLDLARQMAREAGVWTVVLGEYSRGGDSLHLAVRVFDVATGKRVDVARVDGRAGPDVRPVFDELATRLLDLSGAPGDIRTGLAHVTTSSLEAFRAYLAGVEQLNRWNLPSAVRELERATTLDTTFSLAYYKLALARGWVAGSDDSVTRQALRRATLYMDRLPPHERAVISAYQAFYDMNYVTARALYQQLLARDPADADAWYGLGEAWFHDTAGGGDRPGQWTQSLRAFRRTLALDASYAMAYTHVIDMLRIAARDRPWVALLPGDSLTWARRPDFTSLLDSTTLATAVERARAAFTAEARNWVAVQPTAKSAHAALVDAYIESGQHAAAVAELDRYAATVGTYPERPFVEAMIRFAAGEDDRAAADLRRALDTLSAADLASGAGPGVARTIAAAANVFAFRGELAPAGRVVELAHQVELRSQRLADSPEADLASAMQDWRMRGELYSAVGAPPGALRDIWRSAAEAGRKASPARRPSIVASGGAAAVGLLTGPGGDTTALVELRGLSGHEPIREVRALLALSRHDTLAARRALSEPDDLDTGPRYTVFYRPVAAQVYYLLGDYPAALRALGEFGPKEFERTSFDMRWGLLPRARLLRGALYERMGRSEEAQREYRLVVSQWRTADASLRPFVEQATRGLGRLDGVLAAKPAHSAELSAGHGEGGQCPTTPPGGRRP